MSLEKRLYFPNRLEISLIESSTNIPIPKIVLTLTLTARAKNNYHLGLPVSNEQGKITINRDWVRDAMEYERNDSIMDYVTPMEDCWPYVGLKVMTLNEINKAISAMKLYGIEAGAPSIAHTILDMKNANNKNYKPFELQIELENPNEVLREVTIKLEKSN